MPTGLPTWLSVQAQLSSAGRRAGYRSGSVESTPKLEETRMLVEKVSGSRPVRSCSAALPASPKAAAVTPPVPLGSTVAFVYISQPEQSGVENGSNGTDFGRGNSAGSRPASRWSAALLASSKAAAVHAARRGGVPVRPRYRAQSWSLSSLRTNGPIWRSIFWVCFPNWSAHV